MLGFNRLSRSAKKSSSRRTKKNIHVNSDGTQVFVPPGGKISPAAYIHPTVKLNREVQIGEDAKIGPNVEIGSRARINALLEPGVTVGDDTQLDGNTRVRAGLIVGKNVYAYKANVCENVPDDENIF